MKGTEAEEILDVVRIARQFFEQRTGLGERELFLGLLKYWNEKSL